MITNNKKYKFIILAALLVSLTAAFSPAAARYDELILHERSNIHIEETTASAPGLYRVKAGDTLWQVANNYHLTVDKLVAVNGLDSESALIKVGQYLRVPEVEAVIHLVESGDTLSTIAARYKVEMNELMAKNDLTNADFVREGQKIVISGAQNSAKPVYRPQPMPSRSLMSGELVWPTPGLISSIYGMRDGRPHQGIDIAADQGEIIRASKAGRVIFSGPRGTYGLAVIIDHGGDLKTLYAHSSELLVKAGDRVRAGQPIAKVGSTGRSTGPHLHFEVIWQGTPCDPLLCLENYYC